MPNPIKTSQIFTDDGGLDKFIKDLEKASEAMRGYRQDVIEEAKKITDALKNNTGASADNREELEKAAKTSDALKKQLEKYNDALDDNQVKIAAAREATRVQNQVNKLSAKLATAAEGSYNALSAQYALNKIRLNQMSKAQRENTKEGQKLVKQSAEIYEEMKRLQEETGKHVLSVGDYGKALRDLPGPLGQLSDGVEAVSDGFKAMLANPVVLVLGLIAGALAAVYKAFTQTESGTRLLTQAMGFMNGLWSAFIGLVDRAASFLIDFVSDPIQGFKDLGQAIVDNIINRFVGLIELGNSVGRVLSNLVAGNFEEVKKAAQDAGTAIVQFSTGLDAQQQRDFADALKETATAAERNATAFMMLADAQREVRKANRNLGVEAAKLRAEYELLQAIANDDTQGYQQQQEAIDRANEARKRLAEVELQSARNNLSLLNQEVKIRRSNGEEIEDLLDQQAEALRTVIDAESEYTLTLRDNEELRRKIRRDEFERELDYAIDVGDAQKSVLERQLKNEKLTLSERAGIVNDLLRLDAERYAEQKRLVQDFTGEQIDFDSLVTESNERVIREKLRGLNADDIVQGRILEIIRDRKAAYQDLIEVTQEQIDKRNKLLRADDLENIQMFTIDEAAARESENSIAKYASNLFNAVQGATGGESIWDKLTGGKTLMQALFGDKGGAAMQDAVNFVKEQFSQILDANVQLTDRLVQNATRRVESAESALDRELAAQRAGEANRVTAAERELREAKKNQDKALKEQEKAVKAQQALQAVEQTANLITASSKLWSSFSGLGPAGPALAVAAIAAMWGSFIASKVKASQLARAEYGEGHYEELNYGGSHASGNDMPLGLDRKGRQRRVEKGESFAVFNKRAVGRYGGRIKELVNATNKGYLDNLLEGNKTVDFIGMNYQGPSMSKAEKELEEIRKQGEVKEIYSDGKRIKIYKNRTQIYG